MRLLEARVVASEAIDVDALIREARRLRRRRWVVSGVAVLVVGGTAIGYAVAGGGPQKGASGSTKSGVRQRTATAATTGAVVTPKQPTSIAVVNGDLYIADPGRQEILKRSPNARFSVVAGTGVPGFTGDGGPATRARIAGEVGFVALSNGSLFFEQGSRIREIGPGGVIRTVAGLHPSCAGVAPNATSMAAQSARLYVNPLSVDADGLVLLAAAQPCPLAHRLGPFLQLTPTGELADIQLDSSPLMHSAALVDCGASASGSGFTAFLCTSGFGHPEELLVVRENGTTEAYPTFSGGAITSTGGEVVAVRDDAVVRVMSHGLRTVASRAALERLVREPNIPSVIGLALSRSGNIFLTTDQFGHRGCTATISEISSSGSRLQRLWSSRISRGCY